MTKRLHLLLDDAELRTIQLAAERDGLTTSEWVRRRLRESVEADRRLDTASKFTAIRAAYRYDAPAPDIDQMLSEIEKEIAPLN